tara:strand:+ start:1537 stop:1677 length:141 start_codon:yes stop_codon:yes gene_type:complete
LLEDEVSLHPIGLVIEAARKVVRCQIRAPVFNTIEECIEVVMNDDV